MSERGPAEDDMRCIEFVGLVTAYLDDEVSRDVRQRMEDHLQGCQGCRAAIGQLRTVIRLTGRLTPEDVASINPYTRDRLLATLREPRRR
jgi:predicted anti-sigma-YlaC factor YlaD